MTALILGMAITPWTSSRSKWDDPIFWVFTGLVAACIGAIVLSGWLRERQRRKALAAVAQELGMTFTPEDAGATDAQRFSRQATAPRRRV